MTAAGAHRARGGLLVRLPHRRRAGAACDETRLSDTPEDRGPLPPRRKRVSCTDHAASRRARSHDEPRKSRARPSNYNPPSRMPPPPCPANSAATASNSVGFAALREAETLEQLTARGTVASSRRSGRDNRRRSEPLPVAAAARTSAGAVQTPLVPHDLGSATQADPRALYPR